MKNKIDAKQYIHHTRGVCPPEIHFKIQSFAGYSDFEPFALEMNMVSRLIDFMQDESVFPALEAMLPQFKADIIVFSQLQTWGSWHVGDKDFISVGAALAGSGLTWGRLEDNNGRADLKIMKVPS